MQPKSQRHQIMAAIGLGLTKNPSGPRKVAKHPSGAHAGRCRAAYNRAAMVERRRPGIAEAVRGLGLGLDRALIDGEAVVLRDNGRSDLARS
jgi:hypothetical protein